MIWGCGSGTSKRRGRFEYCYSALASARRLSIIMMLLVSLGFGYGFGFGFVRTPTHNGLHIEGEAHNANEHIKSLPRICPCRGKSVKAALMRSAYGC
jgi:hypothetical protein